MKTKQNKKPKSDVGCFKSDAKKCVFSRRERTVSPIFLLGQEIGQPFSLLCKHKVEAKRVLAHFSTITDHKLGKDPLALA